jgi:glycerophosphoryl diester phosphodiesterase
VLRIAHRGMPRRYPENTLRSFEEALASGADGVELDVHRTADGVVVVHHDAALRDGTEIRLAPWAQVQAASTAHAAPVPTLDAVCRLVGDRAELFVEIKGAEIEDAVVDVLAAHGGRTAVHSFDHAAIGRLAQRAVPFRLGLLLEDSSSDPVALLKRYGALDLWPDRRLVTADLVEQVHTIGARVIPWTVNDPPEAARLVELGVDGICTDDVTIIQAPMV